MYVIEVFYTKYTKHNKKLIDICLLEFYVKLPNIYSVSFLFFSMFSGKSFLPFKIISLILSQASQVGGKQNVALSCFAQVEFEPAVMEKPGD